jgi:predicted nuclease of predicted toxin-antitoxin system
MLSSLMDNNVSDRVSDFLRMRGHDVSLSRDLFPSGTADIVIVAWANEQSAIIVTHDRDFHRLIQRAQTRNRARVYTAGRITLLGLEVNARNRVEDFIESIEFEYLQVQQTPDKRLIIEISDSALRVVR